MSNNSLVLTRQLNFSVNVTPLDSENPLFLIKRFTFGYSIDAIEKGCHSVIEIAGILS